jgi:hypothetical protein
MPPKKTTIRKKKKKHILPMNEMEKERKEVEAFLEMYMQVRNAPILRPVVVVSGKEQQTDVISIIMDAMCNIQNEQPWQTGEWCTRVTYTKPKGTSGEILLDGFRGDAFSYAELEGKGKTYSSKQEEETLFRTLASAWNSMISFKFSRPLLVQVAGRDDDAQEVVSGTDLLRLCRKSRPSSLLFRMKIVTEKNVALRVERGGYA